MGFRLSPGAEAELDEIWLYTARQSGSMDVANRLVDVIVDRFLLLKHPQIGRKRDHDLRPGLRSFPVGEHIILYRVESSETGNHAIILHILHGSRDLPAHLRD